VSRLHRFLAAALAAVAIPLAVAAPAHADPTTGTISGTFTTSAGEPLAGVHVVAVTAGGGYMGTVQTDDAGRYALPDLPAGEYLVQFIVDGPGASGWSQWAPRAHGMASAARFTVAPGGTTTVDDTAFPTGSLSVTFRSRWTGEVVDSFCASAVAVGVLAEGCTDDGAVVLTDLPEGEYGVTAQPTDDPRLRQIGTATVVEGQVTEVTAG
jgi:hypothetical protein